MEKRPSSQKLKRTVNGNTENISSQSSSNSCPSSVKENRSGGTAAAAAAVVTRSKLAAATVIVSKKSRLALSPIAAEENGSKVVKAAAGSPGAGEQPAGPGIDNNSASSGAATKLRPAGDAEGSGKKGAAAATAASGVATSQQGASVPAGTNSNNRKPRNNSNKENNSRSHGTSPTNTATTTTTTNRAAPTITSSNKTVKTKPPPLSLNATTTNTAVPPRNMMNTRNWEGVGPTAAAANNNNNAIGRSSSERNWRARDGEPQQQQQLRTGATRATETRPREEKKKSCDFQAVLNVKPFVPMAHRMRGSSLVSSQPLRSPFSGSDGFSVYSPIDLYYSDTGSSLSSANRDRNENVFNFNITDTSVQDYLNGAISTSLGHMSLSPDCSWNYPPPQQQPYDSYCNSSGFYSEYSSSLPLDFLPSIPPPSFGFPPQCKSGFPAYVDQQGFISLQLREKVMVDISVNMAVRLRNSIQQTTVTLSGCGSQVAVVHPKGCVLQYGQRIEIQVKDEISTKNAKMYPKGVSFTANNCALVYLLDQAGTRTTSEMFHDLQEDNVATVLFQQTCDNSHRAIAENIARLESAAYWKSESNVDSWIINGVSVQQTRDGLTVVERIIGSDRFMMKASPSNGKVRLEMAFMQVTASLGDESHLFVRSHDRRLHYNGKNLVFTVRNAGHAAGFDEGGVLRIF